MHQLMVEYSVGFGGCQAGPPEVVICHHMMYVCVVYLYSLGAVQQIVLSEMMKCKDLKAF